MDSIMNIKNYNFRNNILSKNNILIYIHNNEIVNLDINNLYEINFENKIILIRSKDFNN